MNDQELPNGEQPEVAPDPGLQPPQPTPPVYAPPPTQAPPNYQAQPPQYAAPQYPQGHQTPVAHQPPVFQPPTDSAVPQYGQVPSYEQVPQHPGTEQYPQAPYYPQQSDPTQYAQQQYAEQQFAASQQQYAPGAPTGAPPSRKGLPVGAWIGIGAGALVIILFAIVAVLIFVMQKPNLDPVPLPAPPVTEELPDEDPGAAPELEVVTLDDVTNFSAGPFWGVPFESEWDVVRFDEQGVHEFTNKAVGCQFLSYQGYGPEGITSTDDRGATQETISTALTIGIPWTAAIADPEVTADGTVGVPVDWAYDVEMQRFVATYPTADGDRKRQMLLRSFMPNNLALYAEVDCPASDAGNEAAQVILDGLSITEF